MINMGNDAEISNVRGVHLLNSEAEDTAISLEEKEFPGPLPCPAGPEGGCPQSQQHGPRNLAPVYRELLPDARAAAEGSRARMVQANPCEVPHFGEAPAMLSVSSMVSDTLSSTWPGMMLKSLRLMLKSARITSRSPFMFGTRLLSLSFR